MSNESARALAQTTIAAPTTPVVSTQSPGVVEAPAAAGTPVVTPKAETESTRFMHLAKKEAELQKQRESYKKDQEAFTAERAKLTDVQNQIKEYERLKSTDPVAALKFLGFSETDLFNFMQASETPKDPVAEAKAAAAAEIQSYRDEVAKEREAVQQAQTNEEVIKFRSELAAHVASDPVKYEYCNHYGPVAEDLITETIVQVWQDEVKSNPQAKMISMKEATDMVEDYYEQEDKAMANMKKRQPRELETVTPPAKDGPARPEVSARPESAANPPPQVSGAPKTPAPKAPAAPQRRETPEEKRERLIGKLAAMGQVRK